MLAAAGAMEPHNLTAAEDYARGCRPWMSNFPCEYSIQNPLCDHKNIDYLRWTGVVSCDEDVFHFLVHFLVYCDDEPRPS
mmetsp:Transcript_25112/g.61957  ORF Transcript_25112/g.61957 Transcript_25112/m.61957 type:complete len:80 (+) Transcript_25112:793-1032(+)